MFSYIFYAIYEMKLTLNRNKKVINYHTLDRINKTKLHECMINVFQMGITKKDNHHWYVYQYFLGFSSRNFHLPRKKFDLRNKI